MLTAAPATSEVSLPMQKLGSGSGSQWRRKRDIEGSDDNVQVDHKRSP